MKVVGSIIIINENSKKKKKILTPGRISKITPSPLLPIMFKPGWMAFGGDAVDKIQT